MKTFFCMTAALCLASGKSTSGLQILERSKVLYVCREGQLQLTGQRLRSLIKGNGLPEPETFSDHFFIHHRGEYWLNDQKTVNETIAFVREQNIRLVVIDTFAKSCAADESSNPQMNVVMAQVNRIIAAGCSVILVHHTGKSEFKLSHKTHGHPDPDADIRGASAFSAAYEVHWAVRGYALPDGSKPQRLYLLAKDGAARQYGYDFQFLDVTKDEQGNSHAGATRLFLQDEGNIRPIEPETSKRGNLRVVKEMEW